MLRSTVTKRLIRSIHVRESVYSNGFHPTWRRRRARNRKRFGREPNPESRKIRHVKRAATFSYRADYLSSFNSIKNRRVKRAEPGIPPVVKSAPSTTLSPPPFLPAIPSLLPSPRNRFSNIIRRFDERGRESDSTTIPLKY